MGYKDLIPEINSDRNYWLVRTQGGEFYGEFLAGNFIAIDWNKINNLNLINKIEDNDSEEHNDCRDKLVDLVRKDYKDEKRPIHAVRQITQFVNEIHKGDIVIIPGINSKYISYGRVISDIFIEKISDDDIEEGACPFQKRRKVLWLKTQDREFLDPYLYRLLYSQHTITNANDYSDIIDRTLNQFYIKDGKAYFTLKVQQADNISAVDIGNVINNGISIIDEFNKFSSMDLDKNDIDLKINVQSPGIIQFLGNINNILVIGMITMFLVGGGFKFKHTKGTTEGEIHTDGFMKNLLDFIDHLHKNKMENRELDERIRKTADNLKIKVPSIQQISLDDLDSEEETDNKN